MSTPKTKAVKLPALPKGFKELSSSLAGFFTREANNAITGIYRGSFMVKGKFGPKKVHRVQISAGTCFCSSKDDDRFEAEEGAIVGLDETGYLKRLGDVAEGSTVFVRCIGKKGEDQKDPWIFQLAQAETEGEDIGF